MDPNGALENLLDACREWNEAESEGARAEALDCLEALRAWIKSGGFLPVDPRKR